VVLFKLLERLEALTDDLLADTLADLVQNCCLLLKRLTDLGGSIRGRGELVSIVGGDDALITEKGGLACIAGD
jgi:hypothetical protein